MIKYIKEKKLFFIGGKGYSYIMYVNGSGFLQHLYYGKAIKEQDAEYLIKTYGERLEPQPDSGDFEMHTCDMPCEYSAFGRGDYHEPGIIIVREDGSVMSRFLYLYGLDPPKTYRIEELQLSSSGAYELRYNAT